MGELLALGSALSFGASSIFIGRAAARNGKTDRDVGLLITIIINAVISSVALAIYIATRGMFQVNPRAVIFFMLVGVFSSFLGRALFFEGITHIGPARSSAIKLFGPVFTIFVGVVFLGEELSLLTWAGLFVVLGGLILVSWETVQREKRADGQSDAPDIEIIQQSGAGGLFSQRNIKGVGLGILAGASYGTATIFRRLGMQAVPNAFLGTWLAFVTSLMLYFSFMCRLYGWERLSRAIRGSVDINYFFSGIFTGSAQFLILLSLNYIGIGIANTLLNTDAVFTAIMGYFILGNRERITAHTVVAILWVTVGVGMILLGKH